MSLNLVFYCGNNICKKILNGKVMTYCARTKKVYCDEVCSSYSLAFEKIMFKHTDFKPINIKQAYELVSNGKLDAIEKK